MLNNSLTLKEWSELHRPYMSYCLIHWKDQRQRSLNIICSVHDWTLNVTLFQVSELQLCHLQKEGSVFQPQWGVVMVSVNHGQDVQAARTGCRGDQVRWLSFKGGLRVETVQGHLWVQVLGFMGFPGDASGKRTSLQCRRHKRHGFHPWVMKIPWRKEWQPTPIFLSGEPHGQKCFMGDRPWGHKESNKTEAT